MQIQSTINVLQLVHQATLLTILIFNVLQTALKIPSLAILQKSASKNVPISPMRIFRRECVCLTATIVPTANPLHLDVLISVLGIPHFSQTTKQ